MKFCDTFSGDTHFFHTSGSEAINICFGESREIAILSEIIVRGNNPKLPHKVKDSSDWAETLQKQP